MSLTLSIEVLSATKSASMAEYRKHLDNRYGRDREYTIDVGTLDEVGFKDIVAAATKAGDMKSARAAESILRAREGKFDKPVPNFKAFKGVFEAFLKQNLIDGWIYVTKDDGRVYPELVTAITFDETSARGNAKPTVQLHVSAYTYSEERHYRNSLGAHQRSYFFSPQDVTNRRISDILAARNMYKETPELRAAYDETMARHRKTIRPCFAEQFRVNGQAFAYENRSYGRERIALENRKVIHDLAPDDYGPVTPQTDSALFDPASERGGSGEIPEHPLVRVFDLKTHEFYWVNSDTLTAYRYDSSLRDKLILPKTHRDLLDVLTTNLDAFIEDIIEGKSAGNVILCKGIPGVGKTLTAEVYAELIKRPLYAIHSGNLGTSAEQIDKGLQEIFIRAKRWNCVLLLDEADVFVVQRDDDIEQNAIVAEFLRTLEYFDGLLFMTTNRPDSIDDAIISRCAAVIDYVPPGAEDAAAIWQVMAAQYKVKLAKPLVDSLIELFPKIAPRDIKMLFRLALRVSRADKKPLTIETFRRCAMFRAITMVETAR